MEQYGFRLQSLGKLRSFTNTALRKDNETFRHFSPHRILSTLGLLFWAVLLFKVALLPAELSQFDVKLARPLHRDVLVFWGLVFPVMQEGPLAKSTFFASSLNLLLGMVTAAGQALTSAPVVGGWGFKPSKWVMMTLWTAIHLESVLGGGGR